MIRWNTDEQRLLEKMEQRKFAESVTTTVLIALRDDPSQFPQIEALLDSGATERDMVKAVQPFLR